ncbi:YneF family protein [Limosilactobacillus ingluviei]|uniref:Uncharacterized protein n=2 Tax=Limosilactobacillus ingluviei TaxID=148604 RepID=A0A0R2GY84_9LACO|nr:YneF family protein [Limosilactobacillus ingluviei]KRL92375.1 hypothetical protein FC43_GL002031 [Limosilactobacillus ingluviei DSM 15946]KRN45432.1 hypothetical protein IV41_GL000646 [Limosilactobacillus ingluviei]MBM6729197.1 YneF family protein [Limosilactobacillus ingluviei]HJG49508.1 YneF family protein [Limosilactobacillus ingluviei]
MGLTIALVILALLVGIAIGFFGARRYMENYLRNNPPISADMLRTMMLQMGQKPSDKKLHQMMQTMKSQAKKANKK